MRFSSGDHESPNDRGKLAQAEIHLLCDAIDLFLDIIHLHASLIHDDSEASTRGSVPVDCFETNVKAFDQLSVCEQLALMQSISRTLVTERTLGTSLSSLQDAAIAVLIGCIRGNVEMELDCDENGEFGTWRQRVHDAAAVFLEIPISELSDSPIGLLPASDSNFESWSHVIDQLAARWLPDRDFELAELFLDADPEQSTIAKEQLGIHQDYFIDTIDEPAPDDFDDWLNETRQLIRRKPR